MKKFFSEHPLVATCLTTTLVLTLFFILSVGALTLLIGKAISSFSNNAEISKQHSSNYTYMYGNKSSENKLLVIPINGVILTAKDYTNPLAAFFFFTEAYGYDIKDELKKAAADSEIKGILLEINSPGGTIAGARAISDGVDYFRRLTHKPVYAHITELGASGAYWSAASTDKIIADAGSLTGSIGVIMGPFKYYDKVLSEGGYGNSVTTQNGIDTTYITAGEDKDFGTPYKKLSDKAKTTLQSNINNEYERFLDFIVQRRGLSKSFIRDTLGALVYDNTQAKTLGLIDIQGSTDEAYKMLADAQNLGDGQFQVVAVKSESFWENIVNISSQFIQKPEVNYCPICGKMLYLYGNPEEYIKTP